MLAAVSESKTVLVGTADCDIKKALKLHLAGISDLKVESANFLATNQLFVLGKGLFLVKGKASAKPTPLLAFQWDTIADQQEGKLESVGAPGGFGPILYFPYRGFLALYKQSNFIFWDARSHRSDQLTIPELTQKPGVFAISPDSDWLVVAQIATSTISDPAVVEAKEHRFVDRLGGHGGSVLSISFSRDSTKVVTACEDGKLRIFSVPGWKLLQTLTGHLGPVHWAEFSPDGKWLVSAGEDKTARVWSVADGTLDQILEESKEPLLSAAFAPSGEYLAASSEKGAFLWKRILSEP